MTRKKSENKVTKNDNCSNEVCSDERRLNENKHKKLRLNKTGLASDKQGYLIQEFFKIDFNRAKVTLSYAVMLRVIYTFLFLPLAAICFRASLTLTGFSYIRSDNILELFKTYLIPISLVFLILAAIYILFEYALMFSFTTIKEAFSLRAEVRRIALRLKDLYRPKNWLFFLILILYVPGNPYKLLGDILSKIGIPEFIIEFIYSNTYLYIPYLLLVLLLVYCSARYCLIFHYYFFENLSAYQAAKKSAQMSKKYRKELLFVALLIQLVYALVQFISTYSASIFLKPIELAQMKSEFALLRWGLLRSFSSIVHLFIELAFFLLWLRLVSILYLRISDRRIKYKSADRENKLFSFFRRRVPALFSTLIIISFFLFESWNFSIGQLTLTYDNLFRPQIKVMGHRGEASYAPENTLPAILSAINNLAQSSEIDVQLTKDEKVILLHDKTFNRTCGVNKKPSEMSLDEIRQLDAGAYFNEVFKGTKIPTLAEALELARGKIVLNVELKVDGNNEKKLAEEVCRIIEEKNMVDVTMLCSTSKKALREAKKLLPEISCGLIVSFAYGDSVKDDGIDFYSLESTSASKERIDTIHDQGKEVYVWTVNNLDALKKAYENGADGVITDQVLFCREWILRRETLRENLLAQVAEFIPEKFSKKIFDEVQEKDFPEVEIRDISDKDQELIENISAKETGK